MPDVPASSVPSSRWSSIVWKLTVFVGVVVALNGAALIGVAYLATNSILQDQIFKRLVTVATLRQELLASTLEKNKERVIDFAGRSGVRLLLLRRAEEPLSPAQFRREADLLLSNALATITEYSAVWIEDEQGRVIASGGPTVLIAAFAGARLTTEKSEGDLVFLPRRVDGKFVLPLSAAVRDANHRLLGTIVVLVDFSPIASMLMDPTGLEESGEVLVGVKNGEAIQLITPTRGLRPGPFAQAEVLASRLPSLAAASRGEFGHERTTDYRGQDVLVAYRPVGRGFTGWGLIAKIDTSEAHAPVRKLQWLLSALGGVAIVLGLGASNLIARRFARPIRQLAKTSSAVAAGDLTVRSVVRSSDELGALGSTFNRMTEELERSHSDLERRISERTRDLEAARDVLDAFFRISTSRLDPDNFEKTLDSVLHFCSRLGYDQAMISFVDETAGVIRAARATGQMTGLVDLTVRSLAGEDILAEVVRDSRAVVIPDSRSDARCDRDAVALSGIRGQIVVPLVSDLVLGTLQVASLRPFDPGRVDLRPLETLASHTARALTGLRQVEEIRRLNQTQEQHAQELLRSELALREQTRILQSVLDCMGDGVVVADSNSRFLVFNPAAARIMGHGRSEASSQDWSRRYEILLPERTTAYPADDLPLVRAIRGESVDQAELYIAYPSRDDGRWILVTGRPLRDEYGALQGGVVVFHDITRRKKAERRLAAQYETTRVLAEASSPGESIPKILQTICECLDWDLGAFWRVDSPAQRLRCGAIWKRQGAEPPALLAANHETVLERGSGLAGRVWDRAEPEWISELTVDPSFPRQAAVQADGFHTAFAVPILLRGECLGVLEFFARVPRPTDLDLLEMMGSSASQIGQFIDRHQMRGRVVQSEQLASLGMLSAGVAHEINNPLAYIGTNLAVLERDSRFLLSLLALYEQSGDSLASAHPELQAQIGRLAAEFDVGYVRDNMGKILQRTRQGVKRVADIVQNLRGFARLDQAEVDQCDVNEAISAALEMLRGRLDRYGITVEERKGELPLVAGSPAQLNQVFLNLLVNALQAIETTGRGDGRITITTHEESGEILIEISDNGCGIPDDHLPRIFTPFFTTKSVGDGTGLGLSITLGIVQDHGGRLQVESVAGQGTCFRVVLPVTRE
jgi:two-component system, NtrC family, sensor kinase